MCCTVGAYTERVQYWSNSACIRRYISLTLECTRTLLLIIVVLVNADFSIEDPQLAFPPGVESQTSCTNVTIVSDGRLEDVETFCLTLVSSDPDVTVVPTAVTCIVITDVDSKWIYEVYTKPNL